MKKYETEKLETRESIAIGNVRVDKKYLESNSEPLTDWDEWEDDIILSFDEYNDFNVFAVSLPIGSAGDAVNVNWRYDGDAIIVAHIDGIRIRKIKLA